MGVTVGKHSGYRLPGRRAILTGALLLGLGLSAFAAPALAGPVEDAIARAREDVAQGRCEQAYRRLADLEGLRTRAHLLAGQCRIRAGLYPEALADLDRARGRRDLTSRQIGDVELYRGVALYHLERYAEAAAALDRADGLTGEDAQLSLYRGLIALREGDNDRAAPSLETAARLSPKLTEPVASYYAGLAWQGVAERSKAREAFLRVIAIDGDGPWGREAKKLLETTELFPYYARGSVGMEYDSNVLLRGDNVTEVELGGGNALTSIGERDWRGVWDLQGGVQLFATGDWSTGLTASYSGNAHIDVQDLNTHYPTIGAYLAHRLGPQTVAQARYVFGHAWIDEDPYLQTHLGEVSLAHTWDEAGTTVVLADVLGNDLRFQPVAVQDGPVCTSVVGGCSPAGVDERRERNRDGVGIGGAIEHRLLLPIPDLVDRLLEEFQIGGGYRVRYYDSEGDEWEHWSHVLSALVEVELPFDLRASSRASIEFRDFDHRSTFPDSEVVGVTYVLSPDDREEREANFEFELEKRLGDHLSISARYTYTDNHSNRKVYKYDRHIAGGYLNFRFD